MEKNECVEIVNKRFQGKAKEILLNQIELFFATDNEIVKIAIKTNNFFMITSLYNKSCNCSASSFLAL